MSESREGVRSRCPFSGDPAYAVTLGNVDSASRTFSAGYS